MEHLLEAATESSQMGALLLRGKATKFLWLRRFVWNNLPSKNQTNQRLETIRRSISDGRFLKGKVRAWEQACEFYKTAFDTAFLLHGETVRGSLHFWAKATLWLFGVAAPIVVAVALFLVTKD